MNSRKNAASRCTPWYNPPFLTVTRADNFLSSSQPRPLRMTLHPKTRTHPSPFPSAALVVAGASPKSQLKRHGSRPPKAALQSYYQSPTASISTPSAMRQAHPPNSLVWHRPNVHRTLGVELSPPAAAPAAFSFHNIPMGSPLPLPLSPRAPCPHRLKHDFLVPCISAHTSPTPPTPTPCRPLMLRRTLSASKWRCG